MYQYKGLEDTIAAIATPAGQGGIGIVRISGKDAVTVADAVLRLQGKKTLVQSKSHTLQHGWVISTKSKEIIDEVLVTLMREPKSYTTEDVVEINCHGGTTVLRAVLHAVLDAGARLATPGEFTKRAFLHGRMDLTQAEAVIDVINAKTETFLRQSHHQLKGELSDELKAIREELIKIYMIMEALINFPEDDIDAQGRQQILDRIGNQEKLAAKLLGSSKSGRILKDGVRIVLCGKSNVGKSSLLNALLKEQRAIVTDIAGTTRDVLEESAQLKGIPVSLVDTAGILEPRDLIEEEAVKRSHLYIKSADLVLLVLDHSRPLEELDMLLLEQLKSAQVLAVVNKMDLDGQIDMSVPEGIFGREHVLKISALEARSISQLEAKIVDLICKDKNFDAHGIFISNIRHIKALEEAQKNLQDACRLMIENVSWEFISEEIKAAVNQMDAITGRNIDEDLLDRIFSEFCIGK
ncbi:MAG: tRNA uridine-5-carboxymethylaminomethyl(34) synthesis GTPase MnmE [Candidatus Omnitrophica bacterium]|nr:tRNA uridine-5-carboxymethylaminomethyl(34) synthesis GTPase MnmE [Candidatus Omnitrophota bacterium]